MGSAAPLPCLLLCLLCLTAGASAEPQYLVLFPSAINCPYTGQVHVHLMNLDAPVRVVLHLESSHGVPDLVLEEQGSGVLQLDWPRFSNVPSHPEGVYEIAYVDVSIQGGSLQVSEHKRILVEYTRLGTLVQTDKDVYKPGETVKFRIVRLDQNLMPSNKKLPLVVIEDPSSKVVARWRKVRPRQGLVELSFPLPVQPAPGTYTLKAGTKRHFFSVKAHGLPHFEALIRLPDVVTVQDEKIPVDVCGWYPSGKPFWGRAEARLCQYIEAPEGAATICAEFRGQTGRNGCFSTEVLAASFELSNLHFKNKLHAYATLLEDGTGQRLTVTKSCKVVYETATIIFEGTDKFYKPGVPCTGMVLLEGRHGTPLKEKEFLLVVKKVTGETQQQTLITDGSGRASFQLDTSGWNDKISLYGELQDAAAGLEQEGRRQRSYQSFIHYLYPSSSDSSSFLSIHRLQQELPCGQPQQLKVDYFFEEKAMGMKLQRLDVVFLVLAKGNIATILKKELSAEAGLRGFFSLELPISLELAPRAKVLAYVVLPDGELVADSTELRLAKCFPNKVNISFSGQRALVGSQLQLKLQAAPGSLCALYTVDQLTHNSNSKAKLNPNTVYDLLPRFYGDYPLEVDEGDLPHCILKDSQHEILSIPSLNCFDMAENRSWILCARTLWRREARIPHHQPGFSSLLKKASLKVVSNTQLGCASKTRYHETQALLNTHGVEELVFELPDFMKGAEMEMDFSRTWLWELVPVGEGGSAELTVTVPDAITQWDIGMFCTSPVGFGLAPATTLTASKPFFMELALPHAVVTQEAFSVEATVFNYLQQCLWVQVVLVELAELEVLAGTERVYRGCVCSDEARTFRWRARATRLGEVSVTVLAMTKHLCGTEVSVGPAPWQLDIETQGLTVQPPRLK